MSYQTKEMPLATLQRDDLMKMTLRVLRDLGKSNNIHLPTRFSKSLVVDRLLEGDSTQMRAPARRAHKGQRTPSSPLKRVKLSTRRMGQLTAPGSSSSGDRAPTGKILPITWALAVQESIARMDSQQSLTPLSLENNCVQPDAPARISQVPSHTPGLEGNRSLLITPPKSSESLSSHQCERAPPAQGAFHDSYTLILAGGYVLKYSEADFQDIPSTSGIISDASRLAAVWDDSSSLWGKKEYPPLIVRNMPIAMKHWKNFYRQFQKIKHRKIWNNWRQNWYNYQDLVTEYQSLGDAAFKEKWSNSTCSSQILSSLRGLRQQNWDRLADAARLEYPGDAFKNFTYKKNGKWIIPRQSKAIAERYLILKGDIEGGM